MTDTHAARDYIRFLRGLRAVRQFRSDPVPQTVVDDILEVARWSGSATNRQPWELIVVRQRETLQALGALEGYVRHLANAPLGIVLVMAGEDEESEIFDEGRLSERIMLAAATYGIGSCIGWFAGRGVDDAKAILGIPAHRRLRTAISVGYADMEAHRSRRRAGPGRKPPAEIVYDERYGQR